MPVAPVLPLAALILLGLAACSTQLGKNGQPTTTVDLKYLAKTEVDRIADLNRQELVSGLMMLADKLYRRNPREWKKAGHPSREAALERLNRRQAPLWPELTGLREGPAAALAFSDSYGGDRVAALVYGLLTMVDAAFEHKESFYLFDQLDERKLYNCARNVEVAVWKLAHDRSAAGEAFLLANELDPANRNLSFEREFGRLIGLLDFLARVVADRNGRSFSRLTQNVATMIFLPVGLLK
ncbi:hypothetical protein VX159_11950 [Dechloromonas sp. ZY10]|uniref:hypothetical protein n=1 Tax=Dechloromonas aquae TaxID=2664436 RepID=UPI0035292456